MSMNNCSDDIFWTTKHFGAKLGMLVHTLCVCCFTGVDSSLLEGQCDLPHLCFICSYKHVMRSCSLSVNRSECSKLRQELTAQKDDEKRAAMEHLSKLKEEAFAAERAGFENRLTQLNRQVGIGCDCKEDVFNGVTPFSPTHPPPPSKKKKCYSDLRVDEDKMDFTV